MVKSQLKKEWLEHDEAYRELGNGVVLQAVLDWKAAWKALQKHTDDTQMINRMNTSEAFFRSDWYKTLCDFPAEELMRRLPDMAKRELYEDVTNKWINAYIATKVLKPGSKTNDKKIANAGERMREAVNDMWSKWFINLYGKHPEYVLEECEDLADKRIEDEAERKRQDELAKKRARENEMRKSPRKKKKAV